MGKKKSGKKDLNKGYATLGRDPPGGWVLAGPALCAFRLGLFLVGVGLLQALIFYQELSLPFVFLSFFCLLFSPFLHPNVLFIGVYN